MPVRIEIPAQDWDRALKSYSAMIAGETRADKLIPVRTYTHGGQIYTSFGSVYMPCGASGRSRISAYPLVPIGLWHGTATRTYHDEQAILQGRRERGNHTGLVVSVKGTEMVCGEAVIFEIGIPTIMPVDVETAKKHDNENRDYGWRAELKANGKREWLNHLGHPVVRYHSPNGKMLTALIWRNGKKIEEFYLAEDYELVPQSESVAFQFSATVTQLELLFV